MGKCCESGIAGQYTDKKNFQIHLTEDKFQTD